jgi:hypothetical protein
VDVISLSFFHFFFQISFQTIVPGRSSTSNEKFSFVYAKNLQLELLWGGFWRSADGSRRSLKFCIFVRLRTRMCVYEGGGLLVFFGVILEGVSFLGILLWIRVYGFLEGISLFG